MKTRNESKCVLFHFVFFSSLILLQLLLLLKLDRQTRDLFCFLIDFLILIVASWFGWTGLVS